MACWRLHRGRCKSCPTSIRCALFLSNSSLPFHLRHVLALCAERTSLPIMSGSIDIRLNRQTKTYNENVRIDSLSGKHRRIDLIFSFKGCRSRHSDHFLTLTLQTQRYYDNNRWNCSIAPEWQEHRCFRSLLQFNQGLESRRSVLPSTISFLFVISRWHWLLRPLICRNQVRSPERKRSSHFKSNWKANRTSPCMKPIMASSSTFK